MGVIKQLLKQWHLKQLHNRLDKANTQRLPVSYASAKSIGILFHAETEGALQTVQKFEQALVKNNKGVKVLAYCPDKLKQENFPYPTFGKKEISIAFEPKGEAAENFIQTPFDILFNLYMEESLPLGYISACSKAHLRVGTANDKTFYYDLMIEVPEGKDLNYFIAQAENILRNVNTDQQRTSTT
jgi:hypothetical protein